MSKKDEVLSKLTRKRVNIFITILLIIFILLIFRVVYIQVVENDLYAKRVESQSEDKIDLSSGRGIIYDRNGKKLTDTVNKKILVVEKNKLKNNNYKLIDLIKKATGIKEMDIYKNIQNQLSRSVIEIDVKSIDSKYNGQLKKSGILIENKVERYSKNKLLSHTIGYISKVDKVGKMGIEKNMNNILTDSNEKYISVFKAGHIDNQKKLRILKGGIKKITNNNKQKNLKLTIDKNVQNVVEDVANKETNPNAIVVSDVSTGEILAMSSRPNFDPNDVGKSLHKTGGELENRVITTTYSPGSVFKIVVLFSALENRVIDENYSYVCKGKIKLGKNEYLHCHDHSGHGRENYEQAFANSCNLAFYDIAKKLGNEKILKSAEKLHLFKKVDIGLDEEVSKAKPKEIALRNLAIGQGNIEVTPLQINQMTQIIANNGTYKPLSLFKSIVDEKSRQIKKIKSSKSEEVISPYTCNLVKQTMRSVSSYGTAKDLRHLIGGSGVKTGTVQATVNKKHVEHGWVTGYYPANNPKYVITAFVEGNENGNKSAVPMFKEICEKLG